jgi:ribosome maturation factor RimP
LRIIPQMKKRGKTRKFQACDSAIKPGKNERNKKFLDQAKRFADAICEGEGIELVYIEYQRETRGRILRIYIDKPGGVTLDDCAGVSRQLSDLLDVELEDDFSYNLEVSSPGQNRPLWKEQDFERFNGCRVKIKMRRSLDIVEGQKKITGALAGISDNHVKVLFDNRTVSIPFQEISRAHLVNYSGENR